MSGSVSWLNDGLIRSMSRAVSGRVVINASLARLTTFGLGGCATLLVEPATAAEAVSVVQICGEAGIPMWVMGGGSNVVIPDEGIDGVVLRTADSLNWALMEGEVIVAGAGVSDRDLARFALQSSRTGLEWIYDIPGTVGGAVYMNAGNNDGDAAGNLVEARWVDTDGVLHTSQADELELGYRTSCFHTRPGLVVEARFRTRAGSRALISSKMEAIRNLRQSKFPSESLCAGSVFKRPEGHFAGRLIEDAGLGGLRIGDAMVSHRHKGFIVNLGHATAADVLALVAEVQARVKAHSGVLLEPEIQLFSCRRFL